ncbi:MAG: biotin transporter BioY [Clostridia bacterium]|nr:biotin transporter BioY [Clostridia bacterium]
MNRRQRATQDLTLIAISVAFITVCSYISVPFLSGVSFTLQLFAVFLVAALLSPRQSIMSILVYTTLGLIGVPVFAGFRGGISVLFGATGGYLIGFIIATLIISLSVKFFGNRKSVTALSMLLSLLVCYTAGVLWFLAVSRASDSSAGLSAALWACVIPFILPDLAKLLLASYLSARLENLLRKEK